MEEGACAHSPPWLHPTLAMGWRCGRAPRQPDPPGQLQAALAALLACSAGRRAQPRGSLQDGGAEEEPAAEREEPTRSPGWGLGAQGGPVGCRRGSLSAVGPPPSPWRGVAAGLSSPGPAPLTPEDGGACSRACALPPGRRGLGFAVQRPRASRARRGWGASWSRKGTWRAAAEMAGAVSPPPAPSGRGRKTVMVAAAAGVQLIISPVSCQLLYVVSLVYVNSPGR